MASVMPSKSSFFGYPARLILTFVLLNLCVLLLAGLNMRQSYQEAQQGARLTTSNLALVLERNLANLIQRIEISLTGLGDFYQAQCERAPDVINQQIEQVRSRLQEVEAIRITDADGVLVYGTGVEASKGISLADRPHFMALKTRPDLTLAISTPQKSRVNNQWVVALARRLTGPDGSFGGMIFATVALEHLNGFFADINLGAHGALSLRNLDLHFIARHPPLESLGMKIGDQYGSPETWAWVRSGQGMGNFHLVEALGGGAKTVVLRRIDGYPLFVTVAMAEQDYLTDWRLMSRRLGALVGLFLLGSVLVEIALFKAWRRQQHDQRLLAQQKTLYQNLVEEVPFFVLRHGPDGGISFCNQAFRGFFGQGLDEINGQNWLELVKDDKEREGLQTGFAKLTPEASIIQGLQCRMCSASQGERWVQWSLRGFFNTKSQLDSIQAVGEDISERKQSRDIQDARSRLLEYAQGHSLQELLVATLDEAEAITQSQIGFYHLLDADERTLRLTAWSNATLGHYCRAEGLGQHYDLDKAGIWADAVRQRRPIIHNDYAGLEGKKGLPADHAELVRELVVPVLRQGRIVAILGVGNKTHLYSENDLQGVSNLADLAWDLVEKKRLENELVELANTDSLTGLDNRRHFLARLNNELERLKRFDIPHAAVLMLDLDHFKRINDQLGHAAGDVVLRHCAQLMREALRSIDSCGRIGGEEFAILLVGSDAQAAQTFAERLRQKIANTPTEHQDQAIHITISIGITPLSRQDKGAGDFLERADRALYRAKALGRNRSELELADI